MLTLAVTLIALLPAEPARPTIVFVSILPQRFLVERVGGEFVETHVLVGPGQSHHTFEPTPRQIQQLSRARVYFAMRVPFERHVLARLRQAIPKLEIVDTTPGVTFRHADEACEHDHEHGHDHGAELDPHIWLDPKIATTLARNICETLCRIDADRGGEFHRNLMRLERELEETHARIAIELKPFRGREFFVFHPSYGYFADAYGLKQVAVEEGGKEPSLKRLYQLVRQAREQQVKVILVQPQFPQSGARAVADAIGGAVVAIDPLSADYLKNLQRLSREIAAGLARDGANPSPANE